MISIVMIVVIVIISSSSSSSRRLCLFEDVMLCWSGLAGGRRAAAPCHPQRAGWRPWIRTCVCIYIYIYMFRERERWERCVYVYIYIYIYMYRERSRDLHVGRRPLWETENHIVMWWFWAVVQIWWLFYDMISFKYNHLMIQMVDDNHITW